MKKHFFDIPVYRLSERKYHYECEINNQEIYQKHYLKKSTIKPLFSYEEFCNKFSFMAEAWRYNEIIGYIRLYILGREIRGEYYQHKSQRIRKTRRKHFRYLTHKLASEINIRGYDNTQIYTAVMKYLEECQKELRSRYIDIENFKMIGQYIDWNSLLNDE